MAKAATTTRIKQPAVAYPVPVSREEASEYISAIGIAQRERGRIETLMNDELAAIKEKYEQMADPYNREISARAGGIQVWCEAHRAELLKGDAKTAGFPAGEVQWRKRPPSVVVRGAEAVIATLKRLGLNDFVRSKEEINKEAILNEPEKVLGVAGITIAKDKEDFVIKPFESELEEVAV
jgi:phage host-nuclease inhibitor protein Gam